MYCDSKKLEQYWYQWILAHSVPDLEVYRQRGVLWTKVVGKVLNPDGVPVTKHGKELCDPSHPERLHCIALKTPLYLDSTNGELGEATVVVGGDSHIRKQLPTFFNTTTLHDDTLLSRGYVKELPAQLSWEYILEDIYLICKGISSKFTLSSDDERDELTHEALQQVASKLERGKLVYCPGRAPVFNLLTTAIHRIMYSILNKSNRQRRNSIRLAEDIRNGALPQATSLRLLGSH